MNNHYQPFSVKTILAGLSLLLTISHTQAREGMWIPGMIQAMIADDMNAMGMKISQEDLYSINKSCIRDAVVHFDGGCTSVLVSESGLLLTNHHCGYGRIQQHSSLEKNYLRDGFWAMSREQELPNPNMEASVIKEIRDVTADVLNGIPPTATMAQREAHIRERTQTILNKALEGTHHKGYIKPFYHGNQFLLFITEVFTDVRLVGAPPSSIGKFGYDTDNWVWPRHTGDFSVFRIYAGADNKPAAFSKDNVPYKPVYYLPVSLKGVEENDFTLVYGFPGRTDNYITGAAVQLSLEQVNPFRLAMREASLSVIDAAMRKDELIKIQYAAKQSRISNAYKKWVGQNKGLIRHRALDRKDSVEQLFQMRVEENKQKWEAYTSLLLDMTTAQLQMLPNAMARESYVEFYYMGPEALRWSGGFAKLVEICKDKSKSDEEIQKWVDERLQANGFFKNYNSSVDKDIMKAQLPVVRPILLRYQGFDVADDVDKFKGDLSVFTDHLYTKSIFTDERRFRDFFSEFTRKKIGAIEKDPMYQMAMEIEKMYQEKVRTPLSIQNATSDSLMQVWMKAQMEVLPERTYYPDANSTLRLTYGRVEGYAPFDGATYEYYTTLDGIIEKEDPMNEEFNVHPKLKELSQSKEFGPYAHADGKMRVAFIASNHTSGGNSGSPVLDAYGNLIGLNFDRTWESTMSDMMFNPTICRNITVDIRYVLFVMDKFAGAKHLVDEMKLVQ